MSNLEDALERVDAVFSGDLVVGNHDAITMFGSQAQNELKDCSRRVARILESDSKQMDSDFAEFIGKMESLRNDGRKRLFPRFGKERKPAGEEACCGSFRESLMEAESQFKKHQMLLVKEDKMLEQLGCSIASCIVQLDGCIARGRAMVEGHHGRSVCSSLPAVADSDEDFWFARLGRRIDDLVVSKVLAEQTAGQVRLLRASTLDQLDRSSGIVSNLEIALEMQMTIEQMLAYFESHPVGFPLPESGREGSSW